MIRFTVLKSPFAFAQLLSLPLVVAAGVTMAPGKASASCFFTPAICQAICSKDCCDAANLTAATNPGALSKIPLKSLKRELSKAKAGTSFKSILRREVAKRGG